MLRPGTSLKRKQFTLPQQVQKQQQAEAAKLPDASVFMKKCDWVAALTLLNCDKKYSQRHDTKTYLGIAYCAFHNGDYKKAMDIYDELIKRSSYDTNIHAYKACCMYALCMYKEAKEEANKAEDSELKNRLLFQLAQKCGDENEIMSYHGALTNSIEDQLCMAALHYLRSHYEEASEVYKKLLIENKDYHAINVYVALCYYKMDYYDVSLEILQVYLSLYPDSIVGVNLKACNHFQLYNGKAAEAELKALTNASTSGNVLQDNDLLRHNLVVFRGGENALQVFPPLVDVIPEARLNLIIFYLKNGQENDAYNLVKDMECVVPKEYILKAIVHLVIGQKKSQKEHLRIAQNFFQMVGASPSETDTIPGRQCMAQCFYILKQFDDVLVYLRSIKPYFVNDDDFNWNYGIALASAKEFKEAEETMLKVQKPSYKQEFIYISWLCKCFVMNFKPHMAWEIYINMETSNESINLLNLIANDCYKMGQFYYSLKAFDVLERLDPDPEFWEGKRGASIGVFQMVIAGKEQKEKLIEVIQMLMNTNNPQVEYFVSVMKKWGQQNGFKF